MYFILIAILANITYLYRHQKVKERFVLLPYWLSTRCLPDFACFKRFCFHSEINFGIDISRVDRDMTAML